VAIFSLNHSFIGRSRGPGKAAARAEYIARSETLTHLLGRRMPYEGGLQAWLNDQEQNDRKNARVIDVLIVALPKELTPEQNLALLEAFGERMTQGRASWMAGVHEGFEGSNNPHAHVIFRDRDVETGRRVMMTSEKGSTQRFRDAWEEEVNLALERAGLEIRVDARSLKDQGIDREPQLHVGAGAMALHEKQHEFESTRREVTELVNGEPTVFTINYPDIDQGRSRYEENELRKARNAEREGRALDGDFVPREGPYPDGPRTSAALDEMKSLFAEVVRRSEVAGDDTDVIGLIVRDHTIMKDVEFPAVKGPELSGFMDESKSGQAGSDPAVKPGRDLLGGLAFGGLAAVGKVAESVSTLFEGPPSWKREMTEEIMAEERKVDQSRAETQQRAQEAELAALRRAELQEYLQQRDRERHMDRGRGR
jgi:hypothetical protein